MSHSTPGCGGFHKFPRDTLRCRICLLTHEAMGRVHVSTTTRFPVIASPLSCPSRTKTVWTRRRKVKTDNGRKEIQNNGWTSSHGSAFPKATPSRPFFRVSPKSFSAAALDKGRRPSSGESGSGLTPWNPAASSHADVVGPSAASTHEVSPQTNGSRAHRMVGTDRLVFLRHEACTTSGSPTHPTRHLGQQTGKFSSQTGPGTPSRPLNIIPGQERSVWGSNAAANVGGRPGLSRLTLGSTPTISPSTHEQGRLAYQPAFEGAPCQFPLTLSAKP